MSVEMSEGCGRLACMTNPSPQTPAPNPDAATAMGQAMALLQQGQLDQAAAHLHEAAAEALALDLHADAVRLLQLAAATNRSAAAPEMARAQAEHAVQVAQAMQPPEASLLVLALCEAAETAQALGLLDQALLELSQAASTADLPDEVRAVVLRRQASLLVSLHRYDQARHALEQVLLEGQLSPADTARVRLDIAALAQQGQMSDAAALLARAQQAVQGFSEQAGPQYAALRADAAVLQASQLQQQGQPEQALALAREAMRISQQAQVANSYAAASLALWNLLVQQGANTDEQRTMLLQAQDELAQLTSPAVAQATFAQALALAQHPQTGEHPGGTP